eukprot:SAG11_NODE_31289_length_293_cov_0.783505_1_plen_20_part_10
MLAASDVFGVAMLIEVRVVK